MPSSSTSNKFTDSIRSLSEISEENEPIRISVDLVAAARRQLAFFRTVAESQWLHETPYVHESVRRYDELWMPLICDLSSGPNPPIVQPPLDIQWVWLCHTLNQASYRRYCESRFSKLISKSMILDDENEEYALNRCRDMWSLRYPSEPFEQEPVLTTKNRIVANIDLISEVSKHNSLLQRFSEPYMSEIVYLISAKQRYRGVLYLLPRFNDGRSRLVPTSDIQLIWITHQSYPSMYAEDTKSIEAEMGKVVGVCEKVRDEDVVATKRVWESTFDQPYEKAGATIEGTIGGFKRPVYWEVLDIDFNSRYKSMEARFLLEVCVFFKSKCETKNHDKIVRLRPIRSHRDLKIDQPISSQTWRKSWHLYCEFGTRGLQFALQKQGQSCCTTTTSINTTSQHNNTYMFHWNDLLRAPSLSLERQIRPHLRALVSITPPIQAPYLLKCVPDRVTDDSGAMISDVVLKMNRYRPQEGRWLSRTVLDHAGKECFVVRVRVAEGFWRRGGDNPVAVKWADRLVEIREGSWAYIAGSIGVAPEKVVGTARPIEESSSESERSWSLSTGDELRIKWDSSGLSFHLENETSPGRVRLLKGRKLHYEIGLENVENRRGDDEEGGFVTLVRYTSENPNGRAMALMNWKLLAVEFHPDEDAVLVLLISMAILRSASEMAREDKGSLLVRRRVKEAKVGSRDWGSVVIHPMCSSSTSSTSSPHVQPWHLNAKEVVGNGEVKSLQQPKLMYSPAEGGDSLYKKALLLGYT
ncbi:hypothetical protein Syun_007968 [Stephania yunnanensis]|uniref:GRPD C-terminal domain-containing protein n=1 Tax=Stephania yunnanensis TaxID=152371 RepID=A0AAP0L153_9MAGN